MAISNIPTFVDGEIVLASKLNQLGTAVSTKFSGAITGADIAWPLVAQGDIVMNGNDITGLASLWNIVNVDEYDTFALAVAALPTSGGTLFIEPGTTVTTDGAEIDTSNTLLLGGGRSSVLKITTGSSSGYMVRTSAGLTNITVANLTLDGNTATGSGQVGLLFRDVVGVQISNVYSKNFSGRHLEFTDNGTPGNPCEEVLISGCHFEGGSTDQVFMDDVNGAQIVGCRFESSGAKGINGTPTNSTAVMKDITVSSCRFSGCTNSIYIVGSQAIASVGAEAERINIIGNEITSDAGSAITAGTANLALRYSQVCNNCGSSISAYGVLCELLLSSVTGNFFPALGTLGGCDAQSSKTTLFKDNCFVNANTFGIDGTGTDSCRFVDNDLTGSATGLLLSGATTPYVRGNLGVKNNGHVIGVRTAFIDDSASSNTTLATTLTIPANTLNRIGDGLQIHWHGGTTSTGNIKLEADDGGGAVQIGNLYFSGSTRAQGYSMLTLVAGPSAASNSEVQYGSYEDANDTINHSASGTNRTIDWTQDVTLQFTTSDIGANAWDVDIIQILFIGEEG